MDRRHDPVLAARQPAEHFPRVPLVAGLSQDRVVEQHEGVRGEDPVVGMAGRGDRGLFTGEAGRRLRTRLPGGDRLVDVGRADRERNAEVREDLGAAGGGGREDEGRYG